MKLQNYEKRLLFVGTKLLPFIFTAGAIKIAVTNYFTSDEEKAELEAIRQENIRSKFESQRIRLEGEDPTGGKDKFASVELDAKRLGLASRETPKVVDKAIDVN